MGFTKLDEDFFDSSLVDEGPIPVAIFVLLLAKAKADGIAHVASPVVGNRLRLTPEQTAEGFRVLQAPDPHSRSLAHDGRRIERVDGGWLILNYQERRAKAHDEAVREYERDRKRLQRQGMSGTPSGTSRDSYASASVSESASGSVKGEGPGEGPRINPLVQGRRPELEKECLALVREVAELTGDDPIDVLASAAHYEGAHRTQVNPASMTDDRLANTVRDLRRDRDELLKRKGRQ